ncbi:MAG: cytochrome C oxidase subunit IV family protein [Nitriliruptor sp.]|uniref:cytochrome C oxidase subunit IV family protein n=1 Tax=Nitriliruptor sp. TaxID=2448056 RepID=UPI0034A01C5C
MSATETTPEPTASAPAHHGPSPREYVQIALALAVLTALEISTYVVDFGPLAIPMLIGLMTIKFVMVANFFMHLKFDNAMYSRMLYGGLGLAISLYAVTLTVMLFASAPAL